MRVRSFLVGLWLAGFVSAAAAQGTQAPPEAPPAADTPAPEETLKRLPAPPGAELYFHYPFDNTSTPPRITVRFGLRAIGIAPAGVDRPNTGHHHLLIDTDLPEDLDLPIPADENHLHFGGGQTEVKLTFTPGKHTLQLLLGDYRHIAHDPPVVSKKITIFVRPSKPAR